MDDYYVSIHGICFDEGQAGNCGVECKGLQGGECDIEDEMFEDIPDKELFDYGLADEYLIEKYIGEFRLNILMAQTKFEFNLDDFLKIRIDNETTKA